MSELVVGSIAGLAANSYVVEVASGSQLTQPGMVLQVVSTTKTTAFSTTSSTMVDVTGFSASITPKSASSTIYGIITFRHSNSVGANNAAQILRDSTVVSIGDSTNGLGNVHSAHANSSTNYSDPTFIFTDQPSTTSSVTYKLQVSCNAGTLQIGPRADGSNLRDGTLMLMEIAG